MLLHPQYYLYNPPTISRIVCGMPNSFLILHTYAESRGILHTFYQTCQSMSFTLFTRRAKACQKEDTMTNTTDSRTKMFIAFASIGLAAIGLILGLLIRTPVFNTFSIGSWLSFGSFLLSLGSVNNEGSNFFAKLAFWLSFIAMCITIFTSSSV